MATFFGVRDRKVVFSINAETFVTVGNVVTFRDGANNPCGAVNLDDGLLLCREDSAGRKIAQQLGGNAPVDIEIPERALSAMEAMKRNR